MYGEKVPYIISFNIQKTLIINYEKKNYSI